MLLKRELLFKNLFQFITYIHIPDHITVTTDDEDDNSAGPSGVRQGNVVIHVIEMENLNIRLNPQCPYYCSLLFFKKEERNRQTLIPI